MKKLLLALLLSATMTFAQTGQVAKSIVPLQRQDGQIYCSGFVVRKNLVQTAYHCVANNDGYLVVDGREATLIYADVKADTALVATKTGKRPALPVATESPKANDKLVAFGHAIGLKALSHFGGIVLEVNDIYIVSSPMAVPGMSGGPVVNEKGQVVAVIHQSFGHTHHELDYSLNMKRVVELEQSHLK